MKILIVIVFIQIANAIFFVYFHRTSLLRITALRHQLNIYRRKVKKPKLKNRDRRFWSLLTRIWADWASELVIVNPATVIHWQKRRFIDYWRKKSTPSRPKIPKEHQVFIKRISSDHPDYGEDRIALELEIKFGIEYSPTTIRKYMTKRNLKPRDMDTQSWRTFLKNQAKGIWCCDFFTNYTINFACYYVFVIMQLDTRKVVHFNVTNSPSLDWVKQQIRNACMDNETPRFLIHDNDGIFGQMLQPILSD